jgi:hypothetical protein
MGFFDYLDKYEEKLNKIKPVIKEVKKEIIVKKPVVKIEEKKQPFKILPKKVIKNPIVETHNRAVSILEGLPDAPSDEIVVVENVMNQSQQFIPQQTQQIPTEFKTVKSHAAALL